MPKQPEALNEADKKNFNVLLKAARNGDLAVMSAIRKSDGKQVSLVCAIGREKTNEGLMFVPTPLAVMVEGNPFDLFEDPTA